MQVREASKSSQYEKPVREASERGQQEKPVGEEGKRGQQERPAREASERCRWEKPAREANYHFTDELLFSNKSIPSSTAMGLEKTRLHFNLT